MEKCELSKFWNFIMCKKKTWLIMKLTCILIVVFNLSVSALTFSQSKVSVDLKNATLEEFIDAMKEQTGNQFLVNSSLMQMKELITVSVTNEDLKVVLDKVLTPLKLTYQYVNDVVVIKRLPRTAPAPDNKWVVIGKVIDLQKEPLPGVTIRIKGTTLGTVTNGNGAFSLNVPHATDTLVISFIGMKTKEIIVKKSDNKEYEIILEDEMETLNEVTVISTGYQDIDRRRNTSAITSLKMEDVNVAGLSSVDKMLEGHIPGMIFMQNSGQAGAAPKIRIRGTSTVLGNQEPLWVVDGIVQTP